MKSGSVVVAPVDPSYIKQRKTSDKENWEKSYNITKQLFEIHGDKIKNFFTEIISKILFEIFNMRGRWGDFIREVKESILNERKRHYETGSFGLNHITDLETLGENSTLNDIRDIVNDIRLLRSKLLFAVHIFWVWENKKTKIKEISDKFEEIRHKEKNLGEESSVKWHEELCNKYDNGDDRLKIKPADYTSSDDLRDNIHKCEEIKESIEDLGSDDDDQGSEHPFNSGINIFTNPKREDKSYGTFAAGVSGHTTNIGILTYLFTKEGDNESMLFVIVGALIWMIQYYHHSLREMLLAGLIHCRHHQVKDKLLNYVFQLYDQKGDTYTNENERNDIYDDIYNYLDHELSNIQDETSLIVVDNDIIQNIMNNPDSDDLKLEQKLNEINENFEDIKEDKNIKKLDILP